MKDLWILGKIAGIISALIAILKYFERKKKGKEQGKS